MKTRSATAKVKCTRRAKALSRKAERESREATLVAICKNIHEEVQNNDGKMPYGLLSLLAREWHKKFPWITRNVVNKRYMRYRKEQIGGMEIMVDGEETNVSSISAGVDGKKPGRPKGTTDQLKSMNQQLRIDLTNEITEEYNNMMTKAINLNKKVKKGTLCELIDKKKKERGVNFTIKHQTIRRRIVRQKLFHTHRGGHRSPLEEIEHVAVSIIIQMARIRQPLTPSKGLSLINDLISGTEYEDKLVKWKEKYTVNSLPTVSRGYWYSFMKRNRDRIVSKRGQKYELDRQNWTTYANFADMYSHCALEMEQAGVAKKLDAPIWMTREGVECDADNAYGCKVTHTIIRPEMCLCGDEVGGNICMAGDGHVGGELFLAEKGTIPQNKASKTNKRFTLIGLTAFTGEPVICIIILQGKLAKPHIEAGVDILVPPIGETNDADFFSNNYGPGKYLPGGPVCHFNGKQIPAMIRWQESGSITSEILVDALKTLDDLKVFQRDDGVSPFLLLDGHSSRLQAPFLKYINTPEDHYVTCIGVPYGTALWQVGDSKEQNGSFNMAMTSEKRKLVQAKEKMSLPGKLVATDLIPLINRAWSKSFARKEKNKIAIADRGWNPYNRILLLDPSIRATMTEQELANEAAKDLMPSSIHNNPLQEHNDASTATTFFSAQQSTTNSNFSKKLNYSSSTSAFCVDALLQNEDLMKSRERIKMESSKGKDVREQLKKVKKLTAGKLFKIGTTRLGKTLLDIHHENTEKETMKQRDKLLKEKAKYDESVMKAKEILDQNIPFDKLKVKEMHLVLAPLKRKGDKWPSKRKELIALYPQVKDRTPLEFEINSVVDTVTEMSINDDVNKDNIDSDDETITEINTPVPV